MPLLVASAAKERAARSEQQMCINVLEERLERFSEEQQRAMVDLISAHSKGLDMHYAALERLVQEERVLREASVEELRHRVKHEADKMETVRRQALAAGPFPQSLLEEERCRQETLDTMHERLRNVEKHIVRSCAVQERSRTKEAELWSRRPHFLRDVASRTSSESLSGSPVSCCRAVEQPGWPAPVYHRAETTTTGSWASSRTLHGPSSARPSSHTTGSPPRASPILEPREPRSEHGAPVRLPSKGSLAGSDTPQVLCAPSLGRPSHSRQASHESVSLGCSR